MKKALVFGISLCFILLSIQLVNAEDLFPREEGPYFVYLSGNCQGGSVPDTLAFDYRGLFRDGKPMWLQIGPLSINRYPWGPGYDMEKGSLLFVNGEFQDIEYPTDIYFQGFIGYAPATIIWIISAPLGRIRVFGVCEEIDIF